LLSLPSGFAQTDSTDTPQDSFLNPLLSDSVSLPGDTLLTDSLIQGVDSLGQSSPPKKGQKIWQSVKAQLPELYEEDKKMRLRLHFPWREDVVLPFPKGILPQPKPPPYDAVVAWQRSLLIPGWGQAYNRSYWKIPVFLIGYGGAVWYANYNHTQYLRYGAAYTCSVSDTPCDPGDAFAGLDTEGIRNRRNKFRQDRDYAIIGVIGWHIIQVAEAYVDAHLSDFDVSEDLSFQMKPSVQQIPIAPLGMVGGAGISLRF
jgi:hypothetical protein